MIGFIDWLFPKKCVGCGKWGRYVCEQCEVGMWEEEQICPGCCRNSRYGLRHKYCIGRGYLDGLSCIWAYDGLARKLITDAKYKYYFDYLSVLITPANAEATAGRQCSDRTEFNYFEKFIKQQPIVVPVPLYPDKERKRGFNQANIIGKSFASRHKLSFVDNWLLRIKDTKQQVGRSRGERLEAMNNAFSINHKLQITRNKQTTNTKFQIPNKVILVDDVWTTGATMQECAKVLKRAGIKQIWGWVLAR